MSRDAASSPRPANGFTHDTELPHSTAEPPRKTSTAEASTQAQRPTSSTPRILPAPSLARRVSIAPITTVSNLTPRASTAAASPPGDASALPSPVGAGPTTSSYVVPPRPKPGRKPATDEPASKRKAQNRESQRAFRARKAAKLSDMQRQVEHAETKYKTEIGDALSTIEDQSVRIKELEAQVAQLEQNMNNLARERDFWKARASLDQISIQPQHDQSNSLMPNYNQNLNLVLPELQQSSAEQSPGSFSSLTEYNTPPTGPDIGGCNGCNPNTPCQCLESMTKVSPMDDVNPWIPPASLISTPGQLSNSSISASPVQGMDLYADRETDFTTHFGHKQPHHNNRASIAFLTEVPEVENPCGFCTDASNCLCRSKPLQQTGFQPHIDGGVPESSVAQPTNAVVDGPGSCADCRANPQQRAWCQRVAQTRNTSDDVAISPTSCNPSSGNMLATMEPQLSDPYSAKASISCYEAYRLLEGRVPMDQDKMDWINHLKPVSQDRRDTMLQPPFQKYSALELDTAGVIATLGNTLQPIQPRPSDGNNAELVRRAQQQQIQNHSQSASDQYFSHLNLGVLDDPITGPMNWT